MSYIGRQGGLATRNVYKFVPTSSGTTLSGQDSFGRVLSMPSAVDLIDVYLNGVLLIGRSTDYSVTKTTLTFTSAYAANDEIIIVTTEPFAIADMVKASTGGTFEGGLTVNGAFTSKGIDDNADATAITIDSSEKVGIGSTPSVNLHIIDASDEGTPTFAGATHLAVQASASSGDNCNMAIISGTAGTSRIMFGNKDDEDVGKIEYNNSNDVMQIISGSVISAKFSSGRVSLGEDASPNASAMVRIDTNETDEQALTLKGSAASFGTELSNIFTFRTADTGFSFMRMHSNNNNDVEFNFRGDGQGFADGGTFNNPADYAEFFEWKDGNSSNEDRIGYSVILDGNKIVKATSSDDTSKIVGVISGNPVVVGDCAWNRWDGKFVKDDYNRYVREEYSITEWKDSEGKLIQYMTDEIPSDVTVPSDAKVTSTEVDGKTKLTRRKLNPDWDKSKTYIPREDRKEWDMVGMVGKLYLRKGQPTGDRWIKMRDISDTVEEWLVR